VIPQFLIKWSTLLYVASYSRNVREGVEFQEQISFVFYKEGVEIKKMANSIKEGNVNYKRKFSLSLANLASACSI
jgi:hypothetical protein